MNGNTELLNFVYQNAQMGVVTIEQLLTITADAGFAKQLHRQRDQYDAIHREATRMLNAHGADEKGISALEKLRTYLMINLQTLTDKSTGHIAEMMIIGSNMGVIQALRNLKQYAGAEEDILGLMHRLCHEEEGNIEALKAFV